MRHLFIAFLCLFFVPLSAQQAKTVDVNTLSPIEQLAYSTVRVECDLADGQTSIGTGFVYKFVISQNEIVPVLVTNKHVVEGAIRGRLVMTLRLPSGGPDTGNVMRFEIPDFQKSWIPHPDPNIDLCVLPLASILDYSEKIGKGLFFVPLGDSLLPSTDDIDDMLGLDEITMVGYPIGLWDEKNNMPLFRKGVLATNYKLNWNGRPEFLIDAACFPGSSGSPVLICDVNGYRTKRGTFLGAQRIKFLGILYGGPEYTNTGEIRIVTVPTAQRAVSVTSSPINLGVVIKSSELHQFEDMFKKASTSNPSANPTKTQ